MSEPIPRHAGKSVRECATPSCRNRTRRQGNYCNTCCHRKWRETHPAEAAFYNLKHRAKDRGHKFLITRVEFVTWCEKTGYHKLKGKSAEAMSVDRKDETGPYSIENIKMMPLGENTRKAHAYRQSLVPAEPDTSPEAPW